MKLKYRFLLITLFAFYTTTLLGTYIKLVIRRAERESTFHLSVTPAPNPLVCPVCPVCPTLPPTTTSRTTTTTKRTTTTTPTTSTTTTTTTERPPVKEPVLLLLLTYNRCGSSFIGNIFNSNPNGFYVYEPLDATYVHMYGTRLGWNVHGDITHFRNLTRRHLPDMELDGMTSTIRDLLSCNVTNMWPEVVYNDFWKEFAQFQELKPFQKCLTTKKVSLRRCQKKLGNRCGAYFDPEKTPSSCAPQLEGKQARSKQLSQYMACIDQMDTTGQPCRKHLHTACTASALHSVKTVRANMDVAEKLLQQLPNLKVLHLLRDPRAVALSRRTHPSFHSHFSTVGNFSGVKRSGNFYDIVREAALYCDAALLDVTKQHQLSRSFPGRVEEVIFEEFVQAPLNATRRIYDFLGAPREEKVEAWLEAHTGKSRDIAEKWRHTEPAKGVWKTIAQHPLCKQLFEQYKRVWRP